MTRILAAALAALAAACSDGPADPGGDIVFGGEARPQNLPLACADLDYPTYGADNGLFATSASGLVEGSFDPSLVPLTPGQVRALVSMWVTAPDAPICTATFVGPTLLVTAAHCIQSGETYHIRMGADPATDGAERLDVVELSVHPRLDLAWLRVDREPSSGVTPVAVSERLVDAGRVGEIVEAAGQGKRFDGDSGLRFRLTPIISAPPEELWVDGAGRGGLCFGDSGGPLLAVSPTDGRVEVLAVLSAGAGDCIGVDIFQQLGAAPSFLPDDRTPRSQTPTTCVGPSGRISAAGRCLDDGTLETCVDGQWTSTACDAGLVCDYLPVLDERICVASAQRCGGVPDTGRCEEDVLTWCDDRGQVQVRDCGACGESCEFSAETQRFSCRPSLCDTLGKAGHCAGDVLEYCDEVGRFRQLDCTQFGQACGTADGVSRCFVQPGTCDRIGFRGECLGDVAVFCDAGGDLRWENCAVFGDTCGFIDDEIGFFCVDR